MSYKNFKHTVTHTLEKADGIKKEFQSKKMEKDFISSITINK